jgi:hypothetical protein
VLLHHEIVTYYSIHICHTPQLNSAQLYVSILELLATFQLNLCDTTFASFDSIRYVNHMILWSLPPSLLCLRFHPSQPLANRPQTLINQTSKKLNIFLYLFHSCTYIFSFLKLSLNIQSRRGAVFSIR